jgi:outer membrane protein assembly factor BamB
MAVIGAQSSQIGACLPLRNCRKRLQIHGGLHYGWLPFWPQMLRGINRLVGADKEATNAELAGGQVMRVPVDQWNQSGGNPAGSGFRLVNTVAPVRPAAQYIQLPSDVVASSPVIGPNGTIVIGTGDGQLFVCRPRLGLPPHTDFQRSTRIAEYHFAVHTPAVAADGTVYCLCTRRPVNERDHRTTNLLVAVNSDGTVRWTVPIPSQQGDFNDWSTGFVRGAPRLLSHGSEARVFFVVDYALTVRYPDTGGRGPGFVRHLGIVDESGTFRLFHRYQEVERLFVDAHGGGGFGSGDSTGPSEDPDRTHPYMDTPIVFGALPATEPWTIVVPGRSGLYALRWNDPDGSLVAQPGYFAPIPAASAPSAFPNGLLSASSDNQVTFFDTDTFTQYIPRATVVGPEAMVAGGLRHMYCLTRKGTLVAVDSNGAIWKQRELGADTAAFPAVSANHVHVVTMNELRTLTLDLQDVASVSLANLSSHPGLSSPAIGPDGSVYLAIGSWLHCYLPDARPHPTIVRYPTIVR